MSWKRVEVRVGRLRRLAQQQTDRRRARGRGARPCGRPPCGRRPPSRTGLLARDPGQDPRRRARRRGCRSSTRTRSGSRASQQRRRACPRSPARCRGRRGRAAPTRAPGRPATRPASRSSAPSLGTLFCRKSAGTSRGRSGVPRERRQRVVARGEASSSARAAARAPVRSRRASTWRAMMSRKVSPSLISSSDLARVMPMLVPRPPLSLRRRRGRARRASASGRSSSVGQRRRPARCRPRASIPDVALAQLLVVVRERVDRGLGRRPRPASSRRGAESVAGHGATSSRCTVSGREGRQADRDVLGPSALGRGVAHPLAGAHEHRLAGGDVELAALVLDVQRAVDHQRPLVELGALARLDPALRASACARRSAAPRRC